MSAFTAFSLSQFAAETDILQFKGMGAVNLRFIVLTHTIFVAFIRPI
jgi:hypothetical protein